MFVDVVAHGGNLLLNVGPTAAGTIPWIQAQRLLALGWWLRTNGPAIFGTRPAPTPKGRTGEGHEVRFTDGDGARNAIVLETPTSSVVELDDVRPTADATIHLLGHDAPLPWSATGGGVRVELPGRPAVAPALTLRITPAPS
jgi:alpha-L-fucosidase